MARVPWLLAALALVPALALLGCAAPAPAPATPTASPGLRVYRDPVTGAFVDPPAAAPGAPAPQAARAGAAPALVEERAAGGGTLVRLNGAFHSHVTATASPRGADVSCATSSGGPR